MGERSERLLFHVLSVSQLDASILSTIPRGVAPTAIHCGVMTSGRRAHADLLGTGLEPTVVCGYTAGSQ